MQIMGHDLNLNAMNYFEAVARLGGVSKAAEELGVSPSAVSQQIRQIEQQFGDTGDEADNARVGACWCVLATESVQKKCGAIAVNFHSAMRQFGKRATMACGTCTK